MRTLIRAAAAVAIGALTLSGCALSDAYKEPRGRGDAPISGIDDGPATVAEMPNNFSNVAVKCVGPDKVFVTSARDVTAGHGIAVVPNHPDCTGERQ